MADNQTEPEEVDVDLDLEDAAYREIIGKPITVRISGKVITFPHYAEWTHEQTRMMSMGMFDTWAEALLSEDDFKVWQGAGLKNYQLEAITAKMLSTMGASNPGKSQQSSKSRPRRRRN